MEADNEFGHDITFIKHETFSRKRMKLNNKISHAVNDFFSPLFLFRSRTFHRNK